MYVIVVGGGKVGYYLTKALVSAGVEVTVIEKQRRRYELLQEEFGDAAFLGDGCEVRTLEQAGAPRADLVAAVTGDDEDNLVSCQMAKRKFKVKRVIARINNPKNEVTFQMLGIDETVSSTKLIYSLIEQEVEVADASELHPGPAGAGGQRPGDRRRHHPPRRGLDRRHHAVGPRPGVSRRNAGQGSHDPTLSSPGNFSPARSAWKSKQGDLGAERWRKRH